MSINADEMYNNLSKEEKEIINEEVSRNLEKANPCFKDRKVSYMKNLLITMERRKIIYSRYSGSVNIKPNIPVIEQDEKDVEINELKEELGELREQLKARDEKIIDLELALDMLREGGNDCGSRNVA